MNNKRGSPLGTMSRSVNDKESPSRYRSLEGNQRRTASVDNNDHEVYKLFNAQDMFVKEQMEKNDQIRRQVNPGLFRKLDQEREMQMFKTMNEFVMNQIVTEINQAEEYGDIKSIKQKLQTNKLLLAKLFMQQPKVQNLFTNFVQAAKTLIQTEIKFNNKQLNQFLQMPRTEKQLENKGFTVNDFKEKRLKQGIDQVKTHIERRETMIDNFDAREYDYQHPDKSKVPKFNYLKVMQERKMRILGIEAARRKAAVQQREQENVYWNRSNVSEQRGDVISGSQDIEEGGYIFQHTDRGRKMMGQLKDNLKKQTDDIQYEQKMKPYTQADVIEKFRFSMSKLQQDAYDTSLEIRKLVNEADENQNQFENSLGTFEKEFHELEKKKRREGTSNPGVKISELLKEWSGEMVYTPEQIEKYGTELPLTLKQYEIMIKAEEKGYQMDLKRVKQINEFQMKRLKEKTQIMMEAYEGALIETKLKCQGQVERAMMYANEQESKLMKLIQGSAGSNTLVKKFETCGIKIKNVKEARQMIEELLQNLKHREAEKTHLKKEITIQKQTVENYMATEQELRANLNDMKMVKDFYQNIVFKFIRDVDLFSQDEERKSYFETLNENADVAGQIKLIQDLENLDVPHQFIELANVKYNQEKLKGEMYQLLIGSKVIPFEEISKEDVQDYEKVRLKYDMQNIRDQISLKIAQSFKSQGDAEGDHPEDKLRFGRQNFVPIQKQYEIQQLMYQSLNNQIKEYKATASTGANPFLETDFQPTLKNEELEIVKKKVVQQKRKTENERRKRNIERGTQIQIDHIKKPVEKVEQLDQVLIEHQIAEKEPKKEEKKGKKEKEGKVKKQVKPPKKKKEVEKKELPEKSEGEDQEQDDAKSHVSDCPECGYSFPEPKKVVIKQFVQEQQQVDHAPPKQKSVDKSKNKANNDQKQNKIVVENNKNKNEQQHTISFDKAKDQEGTGTLAGDSPLGKSIFDFDFDKNKSDFIDNSIKSVDSQTNKDFGKNKIINQFRNFVDKNNSERFGEFMEKIQKNINKDIFKDYVKLHASKFRQVIEIIEECIGRQLGQEEQNRLMKSSCAECLLETNKMLVSNFKLDQDPDVESHSFWLKPEREGQHSDRQSADSSSNEDLLRKQLNVSDMIKLAFTEQGQLLGFQLRVEMFPIAYEFDNYSYKMVLRALKACLQLNQILRKGLDKDFKLVSDDSVDISAWQKQKDVTQQVNTDISSLNCQSEAQFTELLEITQRHIQNIQALGQTDQSKQVLDFYDEKSLLNLKLKCCIIRENNHFSPAFGNPKVKNYLSKLFALIEQQMHFQIDSMNNADRSVDLDLIFQAIELSQELYLKREGNDKDQEKEEEENLNGPSRQILALLQQLRKLDSTVKSEFMEIKERGDQLAKDAKLANKWHGASKEELIAPYKIKMLEKAIGHELQKTLIVFEEYVQQVERRYLTDEQIESFQNERLGKLNTMKQNIERDISLFGNDPKLRKTLDNTVYKLEKIRAHVSHNQAIQEHNRFVNRSSNITKWIMDSKNEIGQRQRMNNTAMPVHSQSVIPSINGIQNQLIQQNTQKFSDYMASRKLHKININLDDRKLIQQEQSPSKNQQAKTLSTVMTPKNQERMKKIDERSVDYSSKCVAIDVPNINQKNQTVRNSKDVFGQSNQFTANTRSSEYENNQKAVSNKIVFGDSQSKQPSIVNSSILALKEQGSVPTNDFRLMSPPLNEDSTMSRMNDTFAISLTKKEDKDQSSSREVPNNSQQPFKMNKNFNDSDINPCINKTARIEPINEINNNFSFLPSASSISKQNQQEMIRAKLMTANPMLSFNRQSNKKIPKTTRYKDNDVNLTKQFSLQINEDQDPIKTVNDRAPTSQVSSSGLGPFSPKQSLGKSIIQHNRTARLISTENMSSPKDASEKTDKLRQLKNMTITSTEIPTYSMFIPQNIMHKLNKSRKLPTDVYTARAKTITQGPSEFSRHDFLKSKIRLNISSKEKFDTVNEGLSTERKLPNGSQNQSKQMNDQKQKILIQKILGNKIKNDQNVRGSLAQAANSSVVQTHRLIKTDIDNSPLNIQKKVKMKLKSPVAKEMPLKSYREFMREIQSARPAGLQLQPFTARLSPQDTSQIIRDYNSSLHSVPIFNYNSEEKRFEEYNNIDNGSKILKKSIIITTTDENSNQTTDQIDNK